MWIFFWRKILSYYNILLLNKLIHIFKLIGTVYIIYILQTIVMRRILLKTIYNN